MSPRFAYAPHVRSIVHGDRTVVLDLGRGEYYSLDGIGTRVWTLVGDRIDVPAIVARLGDEFDAPIDRITADVEGLLQQLAGELGEHDGDPDVGAGEADGRDDDAGDAA